MRLLKVLVESSAPDVVTSPSGSQRGMNATIESQVRHVTQQERDTRGIVQRVHGTSPGEKFFVGNMVATMRLRDDRRIRNRVNHGFYGIRSARN